jgi:hypothetical protein
LIAQTDAMDAHVKIASRGSIIVWLNQSRVANCRSNSEKTYKCERRIECLAPILKQRRHNRNRRTKPSNPGAVTVIGNDCLKRSVRLEL